jgi:hypothetical protein
MNGDIELFSRPVYIGDDCPDPITQGHIATPTKESTPQYSYTYKGWSATDGGTANSSVLKNITEDKVLYSTYTESVRQYTITYYDTDGTTVLKTQQVEYGSLPGYIPEKSGYSFIEWQPAITAVTGDASYCATWEEKISFAGSSWADIAALSGSGQAQQHFAVGDTRTETLTYADGTTEKIKLTIIGFNHDVKSDGTGNAGITILSNVLATQMRMSTSSTMYEYPETEGYKYLNNTILPALSSSLVGHIKGVDKTYTRAKSPFNDVDIKDQKLWLLANPETYYELESCYEYFDTEAKRKGYTIDDVACEYWLRTGNSGPANWMVIRTNGSGYFRNYEKTSGIRFGFCI